MGYFLEFIKGTYARLTARATKMVTTHNGLTVAKNTGTLGINYFDVQGFDKAIIHIKDTGTTSRALDVNWSENGTTFLDDEVNIITAEGIFEIPIKAPYMSIYYANKDAVNAATGVTIKVYLKS